MILMILKDTFAVQIIGPKLPNDLFNYRISCSTPLLPAFAGEFYFAVTLVGHVYARKRQDEIADLKHFCSSYRER